MMVRLAMVLLPALLIPGCSREGTIDYSGPIAGWDEATGSKGGGQYSPITQINRDNVSRLRVAWTYSPSNGDNVSDGTAAGVPKAGVHPSAIVEATPIIAGDKLVTCTPMHRVIALDPSTGKELWQYDPKINMGNWLAKCRGVTSWHEPQIDPTKACQQRILSTSGEGRLIAIDLENGKPCQDFGNKGEVSMTKDLGPVMEGEYGNTSPPLVVNDLVIVAPGVRDGFSNDMPGGVVRAWDARNGRLVWAWDPVGPGMRPVTAEDAAEGKIFTRSTPDAWGYLSADVERGLIYVPTGHAPVDHYKGARRDIDYYGSSVVALDATTGRVVWSFQSVHHDIWDYDVGAQPVLYEHQDKVPALAVSTKLGHIFLLNRVTGVPIFPVEERRVPASDVPGEWASPSQPFPTLPKPVFPERLTQNDLIGYPFMSHGCNEALAFMRNDGIFTPPSLRGSLIRPGISGGFNWGSGSIDPTTATMVTTYLDLPFIVRLVPRTDERSADEDHRPFNFMDLPQYGTPYRVQRRPFLSDRGVPCVKPPWGVIMAIDLDSGKALWRKPLGTLNGQVPLIGSLINIGTMVSGGSLQTASGLVFIGAAIDEYFRAFDTSTGKEVWRTRLPFSAHATPMTYRLDKDSKQYIVIATGGSAAMDPTAGDKLVAFALPD